MTRLISRREWGAAPARNKTTVAGSARQELTVHNDGEVPTRYAAGSCEAVCFPKIRGTQRFHQQFYRPARPVGNPALQPVCRRGGTPAQASRVKSAGSLRPFPGTIHAML